jgi:hypothetical protein
MVLIILPISLPEREISSTPTAHFNREALDLLRNGAGQVVGVLFE